MHFQSAVWEHYDGHARALPWREPEDDGAFDPYKIMVSEYMLQQTQVPRVIPKYHQFLTAFPTVTALANASLADVLKVWSGLGYNRRAKYIHAAAKEIVSTHKGHIPDNPQQLLALPGIGNNTAAAIATYSFNMPVAFIETNIRTVYIHHFFAHQDKVSDQEIMLLVEQTVDKQRSREWYWALMDYGTFLKSSRTGMHQKSTHFKKQSPFHGSKRKVRGEVIRLLTTGAKTEEQMSWDIRDSRLAVVLKDLISEGLVEYNEPLYQLSA